MGHRGKGSTEVNETEPNPVLCDLLDQQTWHGDEGRESKRSDKVGPGIRVLSHDQFRQSSEVERFRLTCENVEGGSVRKKRTKDHRAWEDLKKEKNHRERVRRDDLGTGGTLETSNEPIESCVRSRKKGQRSTGIDESRSESEIYGDVRVENERVESVWTYNLPEKYRGKLTRYPQSINCISGVRHPGRVGQGGRSETWITNPSSRSQWELKRDESLGCKTGGSLRMTEIEVYY